MALKKFAAGVSWFSTTELSEEKKFESEVAAALSAPMTLAAERKAGSVSRASK